MSRGSHFCLLPLLWDDLGVVLAEESVVLPGAPSRFSLHESSSSSSSSSSSLLELQPCCWPAGHACDPGLDASGGEAAELCCTRWLPEGAWPSAVAVFAACEPVVCTSPRVGQSFTSDWPCRVELLISDAAGCCLLVVAAAAAVTAASRLVGLTVPAKSTGSVEALPLITCAAFLFTVHGFTLGSAESPKSLARAGLAPCAAGSAAPMPFDDDVVVSALTGIGSRAGTVAFVEADGPP
uniref:Putative secreted protein n=1 Tax=Ixodes ricinus TaxID=34613 RepID=A0A6B0V586_IXORI